MSCARCVHMLGSDSEPDQPSGDPGQERKPREEPDRKWRRNPVRGAKHTPDDTILNEELHPLHHHKNGSGLVFCIHAWFATRLTVA